MDYITTYQKEIKSHLSRGAISKLIGDLIILNTGVVITQVKQRWERGQSVEGGIIGTYRWEDYRLFKQAQNPLAGGNVDLFLTGRLSEGLTIRKNRDLFQVYSTDEKYQKIGQKYGFEEYGLTEQQAYEFFNELYEVAIETIIGKIWG